MKKFLFSLITIGLAFQSLSQARPNVNQYDSLSDQILHHIYIPARLIDEDSIELEIHFCLDQHAQIVATEIRGGNPLLRRFVLQQLQQFKTSPDFKSVTDQEFILPLKIRK